MDTKMKVNNSCGAVAVIFNQEDNPGLFQKDNSYVLKRFDLYGRECALVSEGSRVSLLSEPGQGKEEELLTVQLPEGFGNSIRSFIVKWYNNDISLSADVCLSKADLR
jgi:hypothetical protein